MKKRNKGFTIVEAIIVTSVLAAVTVMAFPNFTRFFKMQEETQEGGAMKEIKLALEAYSEQNRSLPAAGTWSADLAPFSALSENSILNDAWGQPRLYRMVSANIGFRAATISIDYAVVYSHGLSRGEGETGVDFDIANDFADETDYPTVQATAGDSLVKFTNYQQQIENYKVTEQRLNDISSSLANFATQKLNESLVALDPLATEYIHYPPSSNTDGAATLALYNPASVLALDAITGGTGSEISVDAVDDPARKASMIDLMRLLGLPDNHCCEALTTAETAFFYYSNPKAKVGLGCAARAVALNNRKLSPRVMVDEGTCG